MIDSSGLILVGAVMWFVHKRNAKRKPQKLTFNNDRLIFDKATCLSIDGAAHAPILTNLSTLLQTVKNRPVL